MTNYTKATKAIAASAWVNVTAGAGTDITVIQNAQPTLTTSGGERRVVGQFQLGLVFDAVSGNLSPMAAVGIGPNVARATGTTAFPTGGWHHLAFSADGAQIRVYVDGLEVARADYLADINPPDIPYLSLGAALNLNDPTDPTSPLGPDGTAPNFLSGSLDDVAVWTRALTSEEVSKIFAAGQQHNALTTVVITPQAGAPQITSAKISGGMITIQWSNGGTLESSPTVPGQWTSTQNSSGTFTEAATGSAKFYRVSR